MSDLAASASRLWRWSGGHGNPRRATSDRGLRFVLAAWLICPLLAVAAEAAPSYEEVRASYRSSDIILLDRDGRELQRVRTDYQGRRGDWLVLEDISPALRDAVIHSEDRRFYNHSGVDWRALAAAAWSTLFGSARRGASTLTMQLTGLIDGGQRRGPQGRSVAQKYAQINAAREMERHWSKSRIFEAYLNLVPFRGELIGVDALARVLFQKHASGLDQREAALAAVMLRAPNAPGQVLARRACVVLKEMGEPRECDQLQAFVRASLRRVAAVRADSEGLAPHFARWLIEHERKAPGQHVVTSIDGDLQRFVLQTSKRHLRALTSDNVSDAAIVVLDNASGQVLAYMGSSGDLSRAQWVDHARALRQAGSTLKPFLYAQAFEQERLTTASLLQDSPLDLPTGNGLYMPQNYDQRFSGWVSARTALASSLNIPAVRVLTMVTPDAFAQRLVQLGLPLDRNGDFYGYSLALGSADVSLLSLANAYRVLANQGRYDSLRATIQQQLPTGRTVMPADAAWIVGDVLSDRHARAGTFGLDSALSTPFWTAVKTGTSKDMRDNWCLGWSQRYTVGVWVGNSSGASMRDVSGVAGAGPIWHDIMVYLHGDVPSHRPAVPQGVVRRKVEFDAGLEPTRDDYFIGDTAISRVRLRRDFRVAEAAPRILSPAPGTVVALDPDIPADNQQLVLQAGGTVAPQDAADVVWQMDGKRLGTGSRIMWAPWPGKHQAQLLDANGRVRDSVSFEVRGAVVKTLISPPGR